MKEEELGGGRKERSGSAAQARAQRFSLFRAAPALLLSTCLKSSLPLTSQLVAGKIIIVSLIQRKFSSGEQGSYKHNEAVVCFFGFFLM